MNNLILLGLLLVGHRKNIFWNDCEGRLHCVVHLHEILGEGCQLSRRLRLHCRLRSKVNSYIVECLRCEHECSLSHHRRSSIVSSTFTGKAGLDCRSVADVISNHIFVSAMHTALSWLVAWLGLEVHDCRIRGSQILLIFYFGGKVLVLGLRF